MIGDFDVGLYRMSTHLKNVNETHTQIARAV